MTAYYTTRELARMLGVRPRTVQRYVHRLELDLGREPGTPWVFTRQEALAVLNYDEDRRRKRTPQEPITPCERELVELVAAGLSVTEAARRLGVNPNSALARCARAREYLGADTITEAIEFLQGQGLIEPAPIEVNPLTPREREVLQYAAEGLTILGTAAAMGLARSTIVDHRRLARKRLGAETVKEAVEIAKEKGWL